MRPRKIWLAITFATVIVAPIDIVRGQPAPASSHSFAVVPLLGGTLIPTPGIAVGRIAVRRNVNTLATNGPEIAALRRGIQVMQSRQASDPTSWIYQANIHGTVDRPLRPTWETCQHGTFFFLSWHRMYLYYFERILRAASGDPNLALPYWNYSDPNARALPLPFRQPQDASNPLFVSQRDSLINDGGLLPESAVDFSEAFNLTNFSSPNDSGQSFGGQIVPAPIHSDFPHSVLEGTPHDDVHTSVGGWMGTFEWAARDPIFWLHHANIDRLWEAWLAQGGGRSNPTRADGTEDPGDAVWLDTTFQFFDENGQSVRLSGQDIVNTQTQLNYVYNDPPSHNPAPEPTRSRRLGTSVEPAVQLGGAPVSVSVRLVAEPEIALRARERAIVLNVEDIKLDRMPGGYYEIYLNLPEGQTPDFRSKYYVGNLAFFGIKPSTERMEEERPPLQSYDITEIVHKLRSAEEWRPGEVKITFVRRTVIPPPGVREPEVEGTPVKIGRVTIVAE